MIKDGKRTNASTTIQAYSCISWVGGSVRIRTSSRERTLHDRGKDKSLWVSILCIFFGCLLTLTFGERVVFLRIASEMPLKLKM